MKKGMRSSIATIAGFMSTIILAGSVIDWDTLDWSSVNTYFKVLAILVPAVGGYFSEIREKKAEKPRQDVVTILFLIMAAFLLTKCVTEKKRLEICKSCTLKSERHDSIIVKEVDRPVPFAVPGPTITVSTPNPCAELCDSLGKLRPGFKKTIAGTRPGTSGTLFTRGDSLHVRCDSDSLHGIITAKDKLIKELVTIHDQEPARCAREHLTKWDAFFIICGKIWLVLIVVAVIAFVFYLWMRKLAGFHHTPL